MSGRNCVTNTITGSVLRYGYVDFLNDGAFDGTVETNNTDITNLPSESLQLKFNKIVGGAFANMTSPEQDTVSAAVFNLQRFNYYIPLYPKGEEEHLTSSGAISLITHATRLDVNGGATMTLADGELPGIFKRIFNDDPQDAVITCSLNQSVSAYVSITLANNGKAVLFWDFRGGFWVINEEKNLTRNL